MKVSPLPSAGKLAAISDARLSERLLRQAVLARLQAIERGRLTVVDAGGSHTFGYLSKDCALQATIRVHDLNTYVRSALCGSIGVAESYMAGEWSCDDLCALVRIFVLNRTALDGLEKGLTRLAMPLFRLLHALRANTRAGSRRNIAAHYDLGNEFYRLFLDETLMYSCAIFPHPSTDLLEASIAKLDHICQKLRLCPNDHLLEIGTGWGGLAMHAARHYGCRVTTTTISEKQYELARERVREARLEERITVLLEDYRDLRGRYDKLVSIEMIEAVGHRYFDTYFQTCSRLLKPDGLMLLQAITIADQEYERAKRAVDFIQHYIFPGGCLPSMTAMTASLARATDLRIFHLEDIGPHYATTLRHWRERFRANLDKVRALGFSESFIRMWEYYLCYCEGGFAERVIGTAQMLLVKPLCRHPPILASQDAPPLKQAVSRVMPCP